MSEILSNTQLERKFLTIEKKITRYNHYEEFLQNYKVNRKYPKDLALKFNLSLCSNSPNLQKVCRSILRNASFQLRDNIIESITEKLQQFLFIRKQSYDILKEKNSSNQITEICKAIKKEKESLSSTILKRQQSKYQRSNITIFDHPRKNRRFRKSKRKHHNNQWKLLYREKERKTIEEAKKICSDKNAINLSNKDLSHAEQSLLRKGPSFIPTPTDVPTIGTI